MLAPACGLGFAAWLRIPTIASRAPTGGCCSTSSASHGARTRTRGLLGRRELAAGEGLAFREKSIHMFFMRMALDIVFCDASCAC